jgi:hypothetical protein
MNPFVQGPPNACNQQLSSDDQAGCNFLYTADLGDGKDPYQVKIRNAAGTGRNLSGVPLASVRNGPFHLLGTPQPSGLGGPAPARFSRFEWLGPNEDGNAAECGPRQVNQDLFDDGMIVPGGSLDIGTTTRVRVLVSTNDREPAGRYNPGTPTQQLYFNGYFDFNADQTFNNADLEIWWQGVPGTTDDASANFNAGASNLGANPMVLAFDLAVPSSVSNDTIWTRARLDYGEDEGRVANVNGDLAPAQGVAQFGEVEDSFAHGVATIANVLCPPDDIVTPGDSLELQFCIEGKGGLAFEYDWLLTEQHGWLVSANPGATGSFFVEPGMSLCITAKVKVPDDCEEGTTDTLCFLITPSGGSPNYNSDTCCVVLQCTGPTPTLLSRFEGVPSASSVRLSFTVPDESDVLGFHVYRSERESGDGVRVTSEPVAASGRRSYELTDSDVRPATGYWYAVSAIGFDGSEQRLGRISVRTPAAVFALGRPEPTPSHAGFSLDFALPRSGRARLTLFDISGREVASLLDETLPAGDHTLRWNGRGRDGRALQGGVYFVVFESAGRRAVTRAVLMR